MGLWRSAPDGNVSELYAEDGGEKEMTEFWLAITLTFGAMLILGYVLQGRRKEESEAPRRPIVWQFCSACIEQDKRITEQLAQQIPQIRDSSRIIIRVSSDDCERAVFHPKAKEASQ